MASVTTSNYDGIAAHNSGKRDVKLTSKTEKNHRFDGPKELMRQLVLEGQPLERRDIHLRLGLTDLANENIGCPLNLCFT